MIFGQVRLRKGILRRMAESGVRAAGTAPQFVLREGDRLSLRNRHFSDRLLGIDMERQPDPDHERQVARYLSAAYVAYESGQGIDNTRKKYADSPVGNFWLEI